MKNLFYGIVFALAGCQVPERAVPNGQTPTAPVVEQQPAPEAKKVSDTKDQTTVDPESPATFDLTYYRLTKTIAPVSGFPTKTLTITASCVIYLTQSYCWDDGLRVLSFTDFSGTHYGPYTYTYWERGTDNGPCHGGCISDGWLAPRTTAGGASTGLSQPLVNEVFNLGVAVGVTCTESDTQILCGDFVITK